MSKAGIIGSLSAVKGSARDREWNLLLLYENKQFTGDMAVGEVSQCIVLKWYKRGWENWRLLIFKPIWDIEEQMEVSFVHSVILNKN